MVILVTGSSGFVGEVLIPKLKDCGFDIIGVDWKNGKYTNLVKNISVPFIIDKKIDVIIHLAARLEHDRCSKSEFFSTNVLGTENMLKIAKQHKSDFIYVSTTAIYGNPESPITEKTQISPNGHYALTKWQGEEICQKYVEHGVRSTIVRPTVVVGEKRLGIYKMVFKSLFRDSIIPILGNGRNKISFVHVDDLSDFLIYLVQKKLFGITVNVGGIVPGDLNQVIHKLREHVLSKSKLVHIPECLIIFLNILSMIKIIPLTPWQLSVMHKDNFYDNTVLLSTGYQYKHNPIDALKSMANFYKSNFL